MLKPRFNFKCPGEPGYPDSPTYTAVARPGGKAYEITWDYKGDFGRIRKSINAVQEFVNKGYWEIQEEEQ